MRKPCIVGDRVLVRIKKDEFDKNYRFNEKTGKYDELSKAGFIVESYSQDQMKNMHLGTQECYVMQIGEDAFIGLGSGKPRAKIGDLITVVRWSGEPLPDIGDGETYKIVSDEDILLRWEGEELND